MTDTAPATQGLHHLGLAVADLPAARDFFVQALGHRLLGENPDYPAAFVSDGVSVVTLWGLIEPETAPDFDRRRHPGLHHAAFRVASEAMLPLFDKVKDWPGVAVEFAPQSVTALEPATHFIVNIPGGPRVEFYCAPPAPGVDTGSAT